MGGEQPHPGDLARPDQVAEVGAREAQRAGRAGAALHQRLVLVHHPALLQVQPPAGGRVGNQRGAVAAEAGGHRAVEGVDAQLHAGDQVVHLADAEQVARQGLALARELRGRIGDHLVHLLLLCPQRAADRHAVGAAVGHDRGRLAPHVLVYAALHDAVDELAGGAVLALPAQAARQPAVGALGRARGVVAIDVEGRALVEDQRDVGAQGGLHRHRALRREEPLAAVHVGAEAHALLLDREDRPVAAARRVAVARGPGLDLLGDRAVPHREDLKAAGVGDDRPLPAHEGVQAAEALDHLRAGIEHQVEGVAEHHLVAQRGHLGGQQALDGRLAGQRHEGGRGDLAVHGAQAAQTGRGGGVARDDPEGGHECAILRGWSSLRRSSTSTP